MRTLFDETKINSMILKNRLVRSATWENMADQSGHMTEPLFKLYKELALGGVGLIITGYAFPLAEEQPNPGMMGIYDDSFIEDYRPLTEMVHSHGSRIVMQIAYGGSQTNYRPEERTIWGPSEVADLAFKVEPREMSREDIQTLKKAYGEAANRAKAAGFDGVQLHAAHGYLLNQFLCPYYNRRTDEYGGSIENRARIVLEIYDEVRDRVGANYPVLIKLNAEDFTENGATFEDCRYLCRELAGRGIDAIEVSCGTFASGKLGPCRTRIDAPEKEAYNAGHAAQLAEELDVPILVVGGIRSPEVIEKLLETSKIEYFSVSRPLLAEPQLAKRWQDGDRRSARCISCNGCFRPNPAGNLCVLNSESA
ncbi:NADH-dependent flavin oxidoreductase, Oye family [Syntrophotalea carbinolica DSM 2380]|uniref:NADH-dependent flavin oxidoreductase, Oye family n=1 Tax=Syntrophotalea carbinolica (strain DSM 2380 / NBRC 103641 / GraBd1) TaxID=338963 RepID=Q3A5M1_SYNC1|nr:NADH:flavin oxidoreductase [Syntrophotalea carbinolica]ABA88336.1 NADH-dependent flavin oxidoreductase, Oye family [Syntrophotalea carbinolica DSM 2380]